MKAFAIIAVSGLCCASALAQNTGVNLTDGDGVFRFGSTSTTTLFPTTNTSSTRLSIDHRINGGAAGTDLGFDMQWYIGLSGRTREFTATGYTARNVVGTNFVEYTFANAFGVTGLNAVITGQFNDDPYGPNTSRMLTTLTLVNNSGAALTDLDAFFSIDNDIAGSTGDTFSPIIMDGPDRILVQSDLTAAGGPWHSALRGYGAHASGAGSFSALNTQLTDSGPDFTALADLGFLGNATAGDYAQMVQWRNTIDIGASITFRAEVIGSIGQNAAIPAPSALALLGLGGLVATRRRR